MLFLHSDTDAVLGTHELRARVDGVWLHLGSALRAVVQMERRFRLRRRQGVRTLPQVC